MNSLGGDRVNKGILSRGMLLREMLPLKAEVPSWVTRALVVAGKVRASV